MGKQTPRHGRVVLVPCPYQGHINPMLHLGTVLHSHGFSITVIHTEFNSPNPSSHPEFTFQAIPDSLSDDQISSGNLAAILLALNSNCKTPFQECITRMAQQKMSDDKVTCIIYDELLYFAEAAARHLKLPSIILRTTSAVTAQSRVAIRQLKEEGWDPWKDSMSQDRVPNLHSLRFKDLPFSIFGVPDNFLELIAQMYDVRKSSAVIWNTMDCLEQSSLEQQQQRCPIPIFPLGPLHKFAPVSSSSLLNEDTGCIAWLDKQPCNSVLYISLGSVASIDETEVVEMAWGLASSRQRFLWVVRPGSIPGSEWIEPLPEDFRELVGERGCIVKWAPQKEVLAHSAVGGFFSHCGWNSTLESISEGVPMICKPCFGDQRVNARYASYVWGIGLQLENKLERKEIERAVRRLMVDSEGEEMRRQAKKLKEKAEICIKEGGSSYNNLKKLLELMSF
ncbi:hypothetical protein SADUNF_Sadunf16G0136200 [Salix dunnii]|uniref:Glycosyltransferase n=1 Tax=Salix dunnii TaxID=1413687 RepID=A0A835JC05_9ROSI|nr:hypothetical protein SADUNF_Sadunf16G0136200 [Salix dunnii]